MKLEEYLKIRERWLEGELEDDEFIKIHEEFAGSWEYDVENKNNIEEVLKRLFGRVVRDKECSCGDPEAIHYYSLRYDLCIHVCVSDPENPLIKLHL